MNPIENAISKLKEYWQEPGMESLCRIQSRIQSLAADGKFRELLHPSAALKSTNGLELHRDPDHGFILLAYSETQGTYRIPHDHGDAWVIYAVLAGEVEMGRYFHFAPGRLALKLRENLKPGDVRLYFPGEIHDTRCVSGSAVILRLTSTDLREEERLGRMHRYQPPKTSI